MGFKRGKNREKSNGSMNIYSGDIHSITLSKTPSYIWGKLNSPVFLFKVGLFTLIKLAPSQEGMQAMHVLNPRLAVLPQAARASSPQAGSTSPQPGSNTGGMGIQLQASGAFSHHLTLVLPRQWNTLEDPMLKWSLTSTANLQSGSKVLADSGSQFSSNPQAST